jgi:hypothetical protein
MGPRKTWNSAFKGQPKLVNGLVFERYTHGFKKRGCAVMHDHSNIKLLIKTITFHKLKMYKYYIYLAKDIKRLLSCRVKVSWVNVPFLNSNESL